jgi:hypothetical protein
MDSLRQGANAVKAKKSILQRNAPPSVCGMRLARRVWQVSCAARLPESCGERIVRPGTLEIFATNE